MNKPLIAIVFGLVLSIGSASAQNAADKQGPLDKDAIRRVIQQHMGEVRVCYDAELDKHPTLAGQIIVRFRISTAGAVTDPAVTQSTLNSPPVERCVTAGMKGWVFPKARAETTVTYPFIFRTVNE